MTQITTTPTIALPQAKCTTFLVLKDNTIASLLKNFWNYTRANAAKAAKKKLNPSLCGRRKKLRTHYPLANADESLMDNVTETSEASQSSHSQCALESQEEAPPPSLREKIKSRSSPPSVISLSNCGIVNINQDPSSSQSTSKQLYAKAVDPHMQKKRPLAQTGLPSYFAQRDKSTVGKVDSMSYFG